MADPTRKNSEFKKYTFTKNVYIIQTFGRLYFKIKLFLKDTYRGLSRGKLSPFLDISQNSTLEKQTLHKIQYEENRLFTKF